MTDIDLDELEKRVTEKWVAKASERVSEWAGLDVPFDASLWLQTAPGSPLTPPTFQFPREQWISYPAKRTYTLLILDRLLDFDLTDEQWAQACFLMHYGGKERVA
jgi:hypothetical protein